MKKKLKKKSEIKKKKSLKKKIKNNKILHLLLNHFIHQNKEKRERGHSFRLYILSFNFSFFEGIFCILNNKEGIKKNII